VGKCHSEKVSERQKKCHSDRKSVTVTEKCHGDRKSVTVTKNVTVTRTIFSGNFLPTDDSLKGKGGCVYPMHGGFCLETQAFPDSINQKDFPEDSVLRPGVNFINILLATFLYKSVLALTFFGNIILEQKLLIKCW